MVPIYAPLEYFNMCLNEIRTPSRESDFQWWIAKYPAGQTPPRLKATLKKPRQLQYSSVFSHPLCAFPALCHAQPYFVNCSLLQIRKGCGVERTCQETFQWTARGLLGPTEKDLHQKPDETNLPSPCSKPRDFLGTGPIAYSNVRVVQIINSFQLGLLRSAIDLTARVRWAHGSYCFAWILRSKGVTFGYKSL